jgi:SpoVK/Ycf46/Vps4 family AAA+-type ATPase
VKNYTLFLAERLEKEGDSISAKRLRKILEENDHVLKPVGATFTPSIPVDSETRFPLIERVNIKSMQEKPLILVQEQWDIVNEFLSIAKSYGQLENDGVGGESVSMIMYGPPGTGKSRLARYIAKELDLDLYIARLDGLISSFLGSTSKNIRALFDFAAKRPCILFLDEFDAIAKLRSDIQEMGELKRVVNSFIQNLDELGPQTIVLAATNHEGLLDSAVWRRFSYRLQLTYPDASSREQLWSQFLDKDTFNRREIDLLVDLSEGFSGSDIQEVCRRLRRRRITTNHKSTLKDAFQILQNISIGEGEDRRFISLFRGKEFGQIAHSLRERNAKIYSHAALARLFGVSKATRQRRVNKA